MQRKVTEEKPNFKVGDKVKWIGDDENTTEPPMIVIMVDEEMQYCICRFRTPNGMFDTAYFTFYEISLAK